MYTRILIFPSKIWANHRALYMTKYGYIKTPRCTPEVYAISTCQLYLSKAGGREIQFSEPHPTH